MFTASLIGWLFGFVGSMPPAGPVGLLVFSRGVENRARNGLFLGVGAALAESGYAFLAFWGFAEWLTRYTWLEPASRGAAALILCGLGASFVRREPTPGDPSAPAASRDARDFALGLSVAALNPALLVTWTAAVTTLYSLDLVAFDASQGLSFALGAFVGIAGWYAVLSGLLHRHRGRFRRATLDRIVRVVGIVLLALGVGFAARFVAYLIG